MPRSGRAGSIIRGIVACTYLVASLSATNCGWVEPAAFMSQSLDELTPADRDALVAASTSVMRRLRDKETHKLWEDSHPLFKQSASASELVPLVEAFAVRMTTGTPVQSPHAGCWVRPRGKVQISKTVSCGPLDSERRLKIVSPVQDQEFVYAMVTMPQPTLSHTAVLMFLVGEGRLMLGSLEFAASSMGERDASHMASRATHYLQTGENLLAHLTLSNAITLSARGGRVQSKQLTELSQLAREKDLASKLPKRYTIGDHTYEVKSWSLVTTINDLAPVLTYVSQVPLRAEPVQAEASTIRDHLKKLHPQIADEYPSAVFHAIERLPAEGEKVTGYRAVLEF